MILSFLMCTCFAETAAQLRAQKLAQQEQLAKTLAAHEAESESLLKKMEEEEKKIEVFDKQLANASTDIAAKKRLLTALQKELNSKQTSFNAIASHLKDQKQKVDAQVKLVEESEKEQAKVSHQYEGAKTNLAGHTAALEAHSKRSLSAHSALHH